MRNGNGRDQVNSARRRTFSLALSAWDLERTRKLRSESQKARIILMRAHERLQDDLEDVRGTPAPKRGWIKVQDRSKSGCLLIHGATSAATDLKRLADYLHHNGLTVCVVRLPERDPPGDAGNRGMWRADLQAVRQNFRLLRRAFHCVHVVGLGYGGALAIHLASKEPVASMALLAPALIPRVSLIERFFLRIKLHRVPWLRPRLGWNRDILEAMETARTLVPRIRPAIYAVQCDDDARISPLSLRVLQKRAQHKASRFQVLPDGGHDILSAHGPSLIHGEILKFFRGRN